MPYCTSWYESCRFAKSSYMLNSSGEIVQPQAKFCSKCGTATATATTPSVGTGTGSKVGDRYLPGAVSRGDTQALGRMMGLSLSDGDAACKCCLQKTATGGTKYCGDCGSCETCTGCSIRVHAQAVKEGSETWHKQCYTNRTLCGTCTKNISGRAIQAGTKKYHPTCLACVHCQAQLADREHVIIDNAPVCIACRDARKEKVSTVTRTQTVTKTVVQTPGTAKCTKCNKDAVGADTIRALGGVFHRNCFLCVVCDSKLDDDYTVIAAGCVHPWCAPDEEEAPTQAPAPTSNCAICRKPIVGKFVSTGGSEKYHSTCFVCSKCKQSPASGFSLSAGGDVLCVSCGPQKTTTVKKEWTQVVGPHQPGFTIDPMTGEKRLR